MPLLFAYLLIWLIFSSKYSQTHKAIILNKNKAIKPLATTIKFEVKIRPYFMQPHEFYVIVSEKYVKLTYVTIFLEEWINIASLCLGINLWNKYCLFISTLNCSRETIALDECLQNTCWVRLNNI